MARTPDVEPGWRMVTGFLPATRLHVHTCGHQTGGQRRAQQQVFGPEPSITIPGISEVIPKAAIEGIDPTHGFLTTWLRQYTEAENIRVNAAMVRNLLDALWPAGSVEHVALVTVLNHYLGPIEAYGKVTLPKSPFREDQADSKWKTFTMRRRMRFLPLPNATA
jgi:hypothetical protein